MENRKLLIILLLIIAPLFGGDFEDGMRYFHEEKFKEALNAYERVLIEDDNDQRARLELARTYMALGMYNLAYNEFQTVLKTNPPQEVVEKIEIFLEIIERAQSKTKLFVSFKIGGGYDTNINTKSSIDDQISYYKSETNNSPFIDYDTLAQEQVGDTFLSEAIYVGHQYDIGRKDGFFIKSNIIYANQNNNEYKSSEYSYAKIMTGLVYQNDWLSIDTPIFTDGVTLAKENLFYTYGVKPKLTLSFGKNLLLMGDFQIQMKKFLQDAYTPYNSKIYSSNISMSLFNTVTIALNGGKEVEEDATDTLFVDKQFLGATVGLSFTLGWLHWDIDTTYADILYSDTATTNGALRFDQNLKIGTNIGFRIFKPLTLSLVYNYTYNLSNYLLSEYKKETLGLNLTYNWSIL